ncbi:MAG: glycosyltransferase family 1 protein, partial [Treponema sp.]|nr:glycosyltransferase family 1 protein [Treponema sp.]
MKIGIDTLGCDHGKSGIGSYLHSFTMHLPKLDDVEFELFGSEIDKYTYNSETGFPFKVVHIADNLATERFWHFFKINTFIEENSYDAVLYPAIDKVIPLSFSVTGVAVVNSIISTLLRNYDWTIRSQIKHGLKKASR